MNADAIWDWKRAPAIERAGVAVYRSWRASPDGATVYAAFVARALQLRRAGWRQRGAQQLVEVVRFDHAVRVSPDAAGVKVNNNSAAFLSREAMVNEPELAGFFETRRSVADAAYR